MQTNEDVFSWSQPETKQNKKYFLKFIVLNVGFI